MDRRRDPRPVDDLGLLSTLERAGTILLLITGATLVVTQIIIRFSR